MWASTEDLVPSSRASRFQTGLLLKSNTDGNLMLTQDKLGTMLCTTWTVSGHPCSSLVKDLSLTFCNGSVSNSGARVIHLDFSTMKSQSPHGSDTVVTLMTPTRLFSHSLRPIKSTSLFSVLIPQPQRVVSNLRRSGKLLASWYLSSSQRKIWYILMSKDQFQMSHTSAEFGNITEITPSRYALLTLFKRAWSLNRMLPHSVTFLISKVVLLQSIIIFTRLLVKLIRMRPMILLTRSWKLLVWIKLRSTQNQLNHMRTNSGINLTLSKNSLRKVLHVNFPFLSLILLTAQRLRPSLLEERHKSSNKRQHTDCQALDVWSLFEE